MTRYRLLVRSSIASGLVLASCAAAAQGAFTVYGGYRQGGKFYDEHDGSQSFKLKSGAVAALSYDWNLAEGGQAQLFYSFQRTSLPGAAAGRTEEVPINLSYLHLGGRVFFDTNADLTGSYLVGGVGATIFSPRNGGLSTEVRPSINVGFGQQWVMSRNWALRAELRGYATIINSGGGFMCSGGCVVSIRGDSVTQFEGLLGLSYLF
jgi:hypothetical protein